MKKIIITLLAAFFSFQAFAQKSQMIYVKGGTFEMGSRNAENDACGTHQVTISNFYMDKYKTLLSDWYEIMGSVPCNYKAWGIWSSPLSKEQWNQMAAMGISWYEALIYCNRRSVLEGLTPCYSAGGSKDVITYADWAPSINSQGYKTYLTFFSDVECDWQANGYRLPTEAEWEYAARGGINNSPYTWSGSNNFREVINLIEPFKIGQKKANALNIHDMSMGPEWCWDLYSENYYEQSKNSINPHGPLSGEKIEKYMSITINGKYIEKESCRVLRGGEFYAITDTQTNAAKYSTVYARACNNPKNYDRSGADACLFMFRVVKNADSTIQKRDIKVFRNIEVKITGIPYYYFMTDDYEALKVELASFGCRAPSAGDLWSNPQLAQSIRNKMYENGVCWSVTSGILNYYTPDEGAYSIYLNDLQK